MPLLLTLISACRSEPLVLDVDTLVPLENNRASLPDPVGGEPYPEILEIVSGGDGEPWWAHGRGYVRAPLDRVWEAATDPEVGVDRREVDEWSVASEPRATLDESYRVQNVVHDVITVNYELWWRHERQEVDGAVRTVTRWDKTDGTTFIDLLSGSLVLRAVDEEVTEVDLVEHLEAALRDDETIASYLRDLHANLVASAHGRPLPSW